MSLWDHSTLQASQSRRTREGEKFAQALIHSSLAQSQLTHEWCRDMWRTMDQHQSRTTPGSGYQQPQSSTSAWSGFSNHNRTPASASSSNNTYLMPSSPSKTSRTANESYRPKIMRTCGQRPACLVNASVTYCGNNQIYAFGGFDQYTDEGTVLSAISLSRT